MENIQKIRLLIGAVISPLIIPLVVYITFVFVFGADVDKDQEIQTSISTASWLSYGIALVLSIFVYFWLQRKQWYSVIHYLVAGTVVGFASWLLFSIISQTLVSLLFFVFVIAGALVGASFWLIAFFQPDGNYTPPPRRRRRRST
jgi:uncharacterized membrane protein YfcA